MICEEQSGFLFAHPCDRPAVVVCSVCGKHVCYEHTRLGEGGQTCVTCVRAPGAEYDETGDDPYFYRTSTYSHFSAEDEGAFDTSSTAADDEGAAGGDFAAS